MIKYYLCFLDESQFSLLFKQDFQQTQLPLNTHSRLGYQLEVCEDLILSQEMHQLYYQNSILTKGIYFMEKSYFFQFEEVKIVFSSQIAFYCEVQLQLQYHLAQQLFILIKFQEERLISYLTCWENEIFKRVQWVNQIFSIFYLYQYLYPHQFTICNPYFFQDFSKFTQVNFNLLGQFVMDLFTSQPLFQELECFYIMDNFFTFQSILTSNPHGNGENNKFFQYLHLIQIRKDRQDMLVPLLVLITIDFQAPKCI
ncbi:hypothetical protein TTHERM_001035592 (macronuclear) [Tetrahymena thermophila SB210]|uniref:Uncharacterized protein n=1 Tax=Tetrahymena thermophila (strain SB210) TaxID=312017 RepID=W7XDV8_TETTS|nr:hypothetical protein TTHERM_001035592 [Tetrahymena thermophila SB210]EWS71009.1 hypothetical protein TTHERM_001035592 [Tetrahymena thermophila SB210]|eukprot:XP_012656450.1 hypothetical protein TTHERM_001035592 [Tetrahymena thermophila SB210]